MCIQPHMIFTNEARPKYIPIPCRTCWACIKSRTDDITGRCMVEGSLNDHVRTVTLTYRNDDREGGRHDMAHLLINKRHFQNFIRALRKRGHCVRYFCAAERGKLHERVHFHAVLFFKGSVPDWPHQKRHWEDVWPHGHMFTDHTFGVRNIRYVCKYLTKDNEQTWSTLSKKPPLGHDWFQERAHQAAKFGVFPQSFEYTPPGEDPMDRSRKYIMSGKTRQNYLVTFWNEYNRIHGMSDAKRKQLHDWIIDASDKAFRSLREYNLEKDMLARPQEYLDQYMETLKDNLEKNRLTQYDVNAIMQRTFRCYDSYWNYVAEPGAAERIKKQAEEIVRKVHGEQKRENQAGP